MAITSVFC